MKVKIKNGWFAALLLLLATTSCTTPQKTVEINGQKVPIKIYSDEQIQSDAWVLTYMTCENELLKYKEIHDSTNNLLKLKIRNADRKQRAFFNRMYVRYFQDSTLKHKFLKNQKEGERLFRPCQRINAIRKMESMTKRR